jgi:hypothetical protein
MKHLLKKLNLAGAGGRKPAVKPAELNPPKIGIHQMAGSFSHAEVLDLISDGPIEGLVDKDGNLLSSDIFQGIYLNDTVVKTSDNKFNFGNILAQITLGDENQEPMKNFSNVYFDVAYNAALFGPYRQAGQIDRITEDKRMMADDYSISRNINNSYFPIANTEASTLRSIDTEGSNDDLRINTNKSYTNWNQLDNGDEKADPIIHVVHNPNVESFTVSLEIDFLQDTLTKDIKNVANGSGKPYDILNAGAKYPAVLYISIETGTIDASGNYNTSSTYHFRFVALIQNATSIDLGNDELVKFADYYKWIKSDTDQLFKAFPLPPIQISGKEQTYQKRYVKIQRNSAETASSLILKKISLTKITEIIPINLNYPFSALVGTKIDSRSFSSIPSRVFDVKLKKIKIPNNYFPINDAGRDKRYLKSSSEPKEQVYNGFWDGGFTVGWTDNPAWILYDMLTSKRYGLGQYIDENKIDKWDLYKIGRFCDAVNENGYFVGASDLRGGLEPRFSCNIIFQERIKLYDSINMIAALFRGIVYYNNSEISFVDDRPKTPSALFTNSNVKDGFFSYSNYKRDEQFNSIEVTYIDRFENFETKIEYVEDEEDIRKRGVFKKTLNAQGVTSRAMARRIAQHFIFQTIKENQSITFMAGLESLLCKPGDLIIIEDELKTLKSNFGRVLNVDSTSRKIRLSEKHNSDDFYSKLTVYTPTGAPTLKEQNNPNGDQEIINYRNNSLVSSVSQITTFTNISNIQNKDFGCEVTVASTDINSDLIQYISEGSVYRFERKNSDDRIYKVLSIKEENPNEYQVIATKYVTGKFDFIEKNISVRYKEDVYGGGGSDVKLPTITLLRPDNLQINTQATANQFRLNASWNSVLNATGYNVKCLFPNGDIQQENINKTNGYFIINEVGNYTLSVSALGNPFNPADKTSYFNSEFVEKSLYFVNNNDVSLVQINRSYMRNVNIN